MILLWILWIFLWYLTLEFFDVDCDFLFLALLFFAWPFFWLAWAASKAAQALRRKVG